MTFDSQEEKYYSWWLDELVQAGYVESYEAQPESFKLTEALRHSYIKETPLKTKIKTEQKEQTLLNGSSYTTDFKIFWNEKANKIFFQILEESLGVQIQAPFLAHRKKDSVYSFVEIKALFDSQNMTRLFKDKQKFLWEKDRIFINLCIVPKIFEQTFTPNKFLCTEKTKKERKLKFKPLKLEDYTNGILR